MRMVDGAEVFQQSISYEAEEFFLEGSSLQAFMDPATAVYEIETLSPSWNLREGEKKEWVVKWRLLDLPAAAKTEEERVRLLSPAE